MKKQLVTAFLLTTSVATFTESYAASPAERLAALKAKAAERQRAIEDRTAAIEASARSIADDRQQITSETNELTGNLGKIDTGTDKLVDISKNAEAAISDHASALNGIKIQTADMAAKAKAIANSLDATITAKTAELGAAIRAGATDIEARRAALQDLIDLHNLITGQVDDLTGAVDKINAILNTTNAGEE